MDPSTMEQVVVKTEMQNNGEILLFYVDENGENEEGVLTTVENIENPNIQLQPTDSYIIEDQGRTYELAQTSDFSISRDRWTDEETQRLLVFYNDNKQTFLSGSTKRKHLWTIACKTMLMNKNPNACDMKLRNLKAKYIETCKTMQHTGDLSDSLLSLCHQAFSDDAYFKSIVQSTSDEKVIQLPVSQKLDDGIVVLKKVNVNKSTNAKVEKMLELYIKYKEKFQKEHFTRNLWETIAMELREEDGLYWQKRFLNFKQHYISLLEKRKNGITEINWPYMRFYDEIYKNDKEFCKRYPFIANDITTETPVVTNHDHEWLETEKMALVKYNYDCFEDFQDPKIPNHFLWTEVGRLLDKSSEACKNKYMELKQEHINKYLEGGYDLRERMPLDIVFDYIISKETEVEMTKSEPNNFDVDKISEIDELAQFMYDNVEMFKDPICYYVCWGIVSHKLKRSVVSCRKQWEDLVTLYKSILNDKKEYPDMQIDWRYIEIFDRIFDYGMDTNLLDGYEKSKDFDKVGVKKVNINLSDTERKPNDEDESFDDKNSKRTGDSKAFKILEYYQKNKDKFSTTNRNKHNLWEILAKQIGISATQCAHRFRNLKQVYTAYVQREINKPEMPIVWPYYALCKKVFGYRAIKAKLKNGKNDSDTEEWSANEINQLIKYFAQNFDEISNNVDDMSKWAPLSKTLDKSKVACKDKFIELRKSYRKLKTQITRNPNVKISWKYFNTFEEIYNSKEKMNHSGEAMEVDETHEENIDADEEDYQCIIVIPEGTDFSNIDSSQVIIEEVTTEQPTNNQQPIVAETKQPPKWTRRLKKRLLVLYINYIRINKGKEMNYKEMWQEIAAKLDKKPITCRKMFIRLKNLYKKITNSDDPEKKTGPLYRLTEKAIKLKPKFIKVDPNKTQQEKIYKDVPMDTEKIVNALKYYTQHIEDFVSPKFEKKFLWTELANFISEPVNKVFNKVNYLKQAYNNDQITEDNAQFLDALREITAKELAITLIADLENDNVKEYAERQWIDEEREQLLQWYLSNLDKFKNPKYERSYLWVEASNILKRSPLDCSKKMSEIRTQYRNMVRENSDELGNWKFYDLCQKIYGTGKKVNPPIA